MISLLAAAIAFTAFFNTVGSLEDKPKKKSHIVRTASR